MDKNTPIKVLNRDNGGVVYSIPEMNGLRRSFAKGEVKEVTLQELEKLSYIPGGMELLRDSLVILDNKEAVEKILGHVEMEYSYTEEDIKKLLKSGSLDEFLDCLDFAPDGVIELIKNLSVEMPLNDVEKREAIFQKTGFSVDNAIKIRKEVAEPAQEQRVSQRRVQKDQKKTAGTIRRVVSKKE